MHANAPETQTQSRKHPRRHVSPALQGAPVLHAAASDDAPASVGVTHPGLTIDQRPPSHQPVSKAPQPFDQLQTFMISSVHGEPMTGSVGGHPSPASTTGASLDALSPRGGDASPPSSTRPPVRAPHATTSIERETKADRRAIAGILHRRRACFHTAVESARRSFIP